MDKLVRMSWLTPFVVMTLIFAWMIWAMRAMWRQMRKVNAHTAESRRAAAEADARTAQPAYEEWDEASGQYVPKTPEVNHELIRQGAKATHSDWFLRP